MQAHWIYHSPLEMPPFFNIKVKILLVRTPPKGIVHNSPVGACYNATHREIF